MVALLAARTPITVAELADQLALPLSLLLLWLGPEGLLRGSALVELPESAELGWALPHDMLSAGRGLHLLALTSGPVASNSDDRSLFTAALPGLSLLAAPAPGAAWAHELLPGSPPERGLPALAELVREHLMASQAQLLSLGGCPSDQVAGLAQQVRLRLQRPVLTLDGAALAGWPLPQLAAALRRLRRDSDLRGAVLIVHEARALGAALSRLLRPRPPGQTAPLFLCSDGAPLSPGVLPAATRGEQPWTVLSLSLRGSVPASPVAAGSVSGSPEPPESEDPAVSASRQEARRQAAIDAARAMGRPVPKELLQPATPAAAATPAGSPGAAPTAGPAKAAAPAPTAVPQSGPPPGKLAAKPPATPPPAPVERPASEAAPRRAPNPRLAAALAAAGLPPVGSEQYRGTEHASPRPAPAASAPVSTSREFSAAREATGGESAGSPVAAAAPVTAEAGSPALSPAPSSPGIEEDGAPLPLEAEAPLDELLRVARSTPNQAQRLELLRKLTGARHSAVIQLFRSFVSSPHPAIREAAEGGMSAIFGPNWNRSRQIAPPVQPPRSDDGGRGPGGAF